MALRICCLGDSNVAGPFNPPLKPDGTLTAPEYWVGFRQPLKQLLDSQGVATDFVGSQAYGAATFGDAQCESYPGQGLSIVQTRISQGMLEQYRPDVVILLAGSNDLWVGVEQDKRVPITDAQASALVSKLSSIIGDMFRRLPNMLLVVTKPATPSNTPQPLAIYRAGIDTIVTSLSAQGKRIKSIDAVGCANDGVHYYKDGLIELARRYAGAISNVVQPPVTPNLPPVVVPPIVPQPTGATMAATATAVQVVPATGDDLTDFVFSCIYKNTAGTAPTYGYLVTAKGGVRNWHQIVPNGSSWATGVTYTCTMKLPAGAYTYQFEFLSNGVTHYGNPATGLTVTESQVIPPVGGKYLDVSANKRYLVDSAGNPWFWMGDTPWTILSQLTTAEMTTYLDRRKAQGFNVIQAIGGHWGAASPYLVNGQRPFLNDNPATPNPAFWSVMDTLVDMAYARQMVVAMAPIWNDFVNGSLHQVNTTNAYALGNWLGVRYANKPNIVWVLGGDLSPVGYEQVYNLMAQGLGAGDGGKHLITFHPGGGGWGSSYYFPTADWLSFSMVQTGHAIGRDDRADILTDYNRTPTRPTLYAEGNYESCHPWPQTSGPRIDDREVRRTAYGGILSGSCGYTYGANGIFQFYKGGESYYYPRTTWQLAMEFPGATSMTYLRQLFESVAWWDLVPNPNMVTEGLGSGGTRVVAAKAANNSLALIYVPVYIEIVVNTVGLPNPLHVKWFDPKTGTYIDKGTVTNSGSLRIMTPESMGDPDYVLVLT